MASKELFDNLFINPKVKYSIFADSYLIQTIKHYDYDLTLRSFVEDEIYEWNFDEDCWEGATITGNVIVIPDEFGTLCRLVFFEHVSLNLENL